jgi:hypothetical protein
MEFTELNKAKIFFYQMFEMILPLRCLYCEELIETKGLDDFTPWCDSYCKKCGLNYEIKCLDNKRKFSSEVLIGGSFSHFQKLVTKPHIIVVYYTLKSRNISFGVKLDKINHYKSGKYVVYKNNIINKSRVVCRECTLSKELKNGDFVRF